MLNDVLVRKKDPRAAEHTAISVPDRIDTREPEETLQVIALYLT